MDGISPAVGCCACGRTTNAPTPSTSTTVHLTSSTAQPNITAYSPSPTPTARPDHTHRSVGNCIGVGYITTVDECSAAAAALGLADVTANSNATLAAEVFVDAGSNDMPHGCYFRGTSRPNQMLWFNRFGNHTYEHESDEDGVLLHRESICRIDPSYVLQPVGNCDGRGHVATALECSNAAAVLGLDDITANTNGTLAAEVFVDDDDTNFMPHGCYFRGTSHPDQMLWFNPYGNSSYGDHEERESVCRTAAQMPASVTTACVDMVDFADSDGTRCATYVAQRWCADGAHGPDWDLAWGSLDSHANVNGYSPADGCCACGRTSAALINEPPSTTASESATLTTPRSVSAPRAEESSTNGPIVATVSTSQYGSNDLPCHDTDGWTDGEGVGCAEYVVSNWCGGGTYGTHWRSSYGQFSDYGNSFGEDAGVACCACGKIGTHSPTTAPTQGPTASPSTSAPTGSPASAAPTADPSAMPSTSPPTAYPSPTPTLSTPTADPSAMSTLLEPTALPSAMQTSSEPTAARTGMPSSGEPTSTPSGTPSSSEPSAAPSSLPSSTARTVGQSVLPTYGPSTGPSLGPTAAPSMLPTPSEPTAMPSTMRASSTPTTVPASSEPTTAPSSLPTSSAPTDVPSRMPTSVRPTDAPTNLPTTSDPTAGPSAMPTTPAPTLAPTASPSRTPTASPTPHACNDGRHGCDITRFGVCYEYLDSTLGYRCDCAPSHRCSDGDCATVAHTCVPNTASPTSSVPASHPTSVPTDRLSGHQASSTPSRTPTASEPTMSPTTGVPSNAASGRPTPAPASSLPTAGTSLTPSTVLELYGSGDGLDDDVGSGDVSGEDGSGDISETAVVVRISFALDYTAVDMGHLIDAVMDQLARLCANPARVFLEYGSGLQGVSEPGTTVVAIHVHDYSVIRDILESLTARNFTVALGNETYVGWIAGQSSQMPTTENNDPGIGESVAVTAAVEWWRDPYFTVPVGSVLFALLLLCIVHKLTQVKRRRSLRKPVQPRGPAVLLSQSPRKESAKWTAVPDGIEELQHDQLQRDLAASTRTQSDTIAQSKPSLIGNGNPGSQRSMSLASSSGSYNSPIQLRPDTVKHKQVMKLQRGWENPYTLASPLNPDEHHQGVTSNGRLTSNGHMLQSFHKEWRSGSNEADYDMVAPVDTRTGNCRQQNTHDTSAAAVRGAGRHSAGNTAADDGSSSDDDDMLCEIGSSRRGNYDMAAAEAAEEFEQSYEMARARASRSSLRSISRGCEQDYDLALLDNATQDDYEMAMAILENTKPDVPDGHHRFSVDSADHESHHENWYECAAPAPAPEASAAENDYTFAAPIPTIRHCHHHHHDGPVRENEYDFAAPVPAQHAYAHATPIATAEQRVNGSEFAVAQDSGLRGVSLFHEPPNARYTMGAPLPPSAGDNFGVVAPLPDYSRNSTASDSDAEHPFMSFASSVAEAENADGRGSGDADTGGRWATPSTRSAKMEPAVIVAPRPTIPAPVASPRVNVPPPPSWANRSDVGVGSVRRATTDMNATKRRLDALFGGKDLIKPLPPKAPRPCPTGRGMPQERIEVLPLNIPRSQHSVQASIDIDEAKAQLESIFGNLPVAPLPNYYKVETDL